MPAVLHPGSGVPGVSGVVWRHLKCYTSDQLSTFGVAIYTSLTSAQLWESIAVPDGPKERKEEVTC
jgi:hypothetical protein